MSPSDKPKALISKKPRYTLGGSTLCSFTVRSAISHRAKTVWPQVVGQPRQGRQKVFLLVVSIVLRAVHLLQEDLRIVDVAKPGAVLGQVLKVLKGRLGKGL